MNIFYLKLIGLSLILFLSIRFIKQQSEAIISQELISTISDIKNSQSNAVFFLGSSRVQKSLNPDIFKQEFDQYEFYNLGITSNTFLENSLLLEYLIRHSNAKLIIVELNLLQLELQPELLNLLNGLDPNYNIIPPLLDFTDELPLLTSAQLYSSLINHYLFTSLSLKKDFKKLIGYQQHQIANKRFGYRPTNENRYKNTDVFLKPSELIKKKGTFPNREIYQHIINYLVQLAKMNQIKLKFYLPLTFRHKEERALVVPLFHSIHDSLKINFDDDFLIKMTKSNFLNDKNHLNSTGADYYSNLFLSILRPLLN